MGYHFRGQEQAVPEEILRWATPVYHFRRTAMADTAIAGQEIKQGEIPGLRRIDVRVRPAGSTAAADQWTASLSGVLGRDIAPATGAEPDWDPAPSGGPPGDNGAPADGQSPESGTPAGGDPMQPPPDAGIQPAGEGAT